jgi:hypothetical protein
LSPHVTAWTRRLGKPGEFPGDGERCQHGHRPVDVRRQDSVRRHAVIWRDHRRPTLYAAVEALSAVAAEARMVVVQERSGLPARYGEGQRG